MPIETVTGDLLEQDVEVIVNPWNRNLVPWWLLVPHGVSGAIRRQAGTAPFRELARHRLLPLGGAVLTGAGRLPHRGIIHVAGIGLLWLASERSIRASVDNALSLADAHGFRSIALPMIGAGVGGAGLDTVAQTIGEEASRHAYTGEVRLVRYSGVRS